MSLERHCLCWMRFKIARTRVQLLKFFKLDGRYDVIGTGSLLGVKGYGSKEPKSIPVGYETVLDMSPLDFEEFLWANGITEQVIAFLRQCLQNGTPVPEALHQRMRELLLQYTVVGGMPDAVQTFVNTKRMDDVLQIQRDIVRSYEDDMVKYADRKDKAVIRECFQSIPKQLSKENKKFQYSVVKKGRYRFQVCGQPAMDRGCRHHYPLLQPFHHGTSVGRKCRPRCFQGLHEGHRTFRLDAGGRHAV